MSRSSPNQIINSKVPEFMCLCLHAYFKFAQGIKVFEYTEQHHDEMLVTVKTLHVSFASVRFAAYFKNLFAYFIALLIALISA